MATTQNLGGNQLVSNQAAQVKNGEISDLLNELELQISVLADTLTDTANRLNPVLRSETSEKELYDEPHAVTATYLGDTLLGQINRIRFLNGSLASINNRVEL